MHTIGGVAVARYKAVVDALASDIRAGRLPPGRGCRPIVSSRPREGIALVTASRVYAELEAMGLVSGEQGRGTFVRDIALPPGHGIDQRAVGRGHHRAQLQLPALPGQADLLRHALRQLAAPVTWRPCCATNPMAADRTNGQRWPGICGCAGCAVERRPGADRQRRAARPGHDGHGDAPARRRRRGRRAHLPGLQGAGRGAAAGAGAAARWPRRPRPRCPRAAVRDPAGPGRLRDADPAQPARLGDGRRRRARDWSRSRGGTGCSSSRTPPTPISPSDRRHRWPHSRPTSPCTSLGCPRAWRPVCVSDSSRRRPHWCRRSSVRSARPPGTPRPSTAIACRWIDDGTVDHLEAAKRDDAGPAGDRPRRAGRPAAWSATRRPTSSGSRCRRTRAPIGSRRPCAGAHLGIYRRTVRDLDSRATGDPAGAGLGRPRQPASGAGRGQGGRRGRSLPVEDSSAPARLRGTSSHTGNT